MSNFSLKALSKELQNNSIKNKEDNDVRKSMTLRLNHTDEEKDLEENKNNNKNNNPNKNTNGIIKNGIIYEKMKKKFIFSNNGDSNSIYNNYNNMKLTKATNQKNKNNQNLNKSLNTYNTNNILKNNTSKKYDKKLPQYIARINNYYNKYNLNSDSKANKYPKKNFEILNKKRGSIDSTKNFQFNKYTTKTNSQGIYIPKKEGSKDLSTSSNKSNIQFNSAEKKYRSNSIHKRQSFHKKSTISPEKLQSFFTEIKDKKDKVIDIFKKNKNITPREEAYYLLSISPVLRLTENLFFSRATKNLKNVISIENLLNNNNIYLNAKANELLEEILFCERRIKTPFTASKIADITLNFITSTDEQEFKNFDIIETNKDLLNSYYVYIKLLYVLFNISYDDDIEGKQLKNNLYEKIKEKGFSQIKDYLYYIYIAKKENTTTIVTKIDFIKDEIIKADPNILNFQESFKICRFTSFSIYLIKEIIDFANTMKDIVELKFRAEYFLDIVKERIDKLQDRITKKNKKK